MKRRLLLAAALLGCLPAPFAFAADAPPLALAEVYRPGMPLDDFWVSEKYDGVRGYWDGQKLRLRGGEVITPPAWFVAGWPTVPMDGELWAGRGKFSFAVATVRSASARDADWRELRFMVFDLPAEPGDFNHRLEKLRRLLPIPATPWLVPVPQQRAGTAAELQALLDRTVKGGGEGLMLHRGSSLYRVGRSDDLLKFKPYDDADARVIAHLPGKGRHAHRMGALLVETRDGKRFKLGSGFTDAQREAPPPPGSWVSYRFNGLTSGGLPRFARFLRERPDLG
ncbi:DNA ligase [Variovorax dokdonensis]|uniref:DNA ligase n=1 Tax=Variovorax dokdonensis TaxID=344883 RepID=A0ABT7NH36_9BURK|nr:DNA ligase [Variovorax dokdonensis]MDM0047278.1 DNA ligase [Variovorax dokdonensis]